MWIAIYMYKLYSICYCIQATCDEVGFRNCERFSIELVVTFRICELLCFQGKKVGHHLHKFGLHSTNLNDKFKVNFFSKLKRIGKKFNDKILFSLNSLEQIKMFLLQLLQQRIKFTPYGLFDIDLGLFSMVSKVFLLLMISLFYSFSFQQITGAVVTYILILIQFDMAQKT